MRSISEAVEQSPEQLADRIRQRETEAALLPPGVARHAVMIEIAQLRAIADIKRRLASPPPGS